MSNTTYFKEHDIRFYPMPKNPRFIDFTGHRFGRLIVLGYAGKPNKNPLWFCKCDCGNVIRVQRSNLTTGHTTSCDCYRREITSKMMTTHGWADKISEYTIFLGARRRCNKPTDAAYRNYGGRGIEFRFNSFEEFLAEVGRRPSPKHSLNRINNDGHYEKGNVEWATQIQQARNTRQNRLLTLNGKTQCVVAWIEETKLAAGTLQKRLRRGWCDTCTLTLPPKSNCPHRKLKRGNTVAEMAAVEGKNYGR